MAMHVCPRCREVIICFGDEESIRCSKCETVFEVGNDIDDNLNEDA